MVQLPPVTDEADSPAYDNFAAMLRDLRGYEPPADGNGYNVVDDVSRQYRLMLVLRFLEEIQMAVDVMQVNQDLALDQLNQKIMYLERIMEDMVHMEFVDR
ncbi:hypothetical protein MTO96_048982 [Rhipicephalus appendiculatus]